MIIKDSLFHKKYWNLCLPQLFYFAHNFNKGELSYLRYAERTVDQFQRMCFQGLSQRFGAFLAEDILE